jgi:addiction module HigA family antidote
MKPQRTKHVRPTHPGEVLKEIVLPELGVSQAEFAQRLRISASTMSAILNAKRSVTPEIAARLEKLAGSTADMWLRMQQAVDLWDAKHAPQHESTHARLRRLAG